jgi:hypothetical protein
VGWLFKSHTKKPSPAKQRVVDDHEHYGANPGYDEAIKIQTRTAGLPQQISQETANECPDNAYQTIATQTATRLVENFTADETDCQTDHNPGDKRQGRTFLAVQNEQTRSVTDAD